MATKNLFFSKFFYLVLFEASFTSFLEDEKSSRSHKTVGIKVFLTIFARDTVYAQSFVLEQLRIVITKLKITKPIITTVITSRCNYTLTRAP